MQKVLSHIIGGLIRPPDKLELPVTDHCNLTCRDCNHSSPALARWFADPDQVASDFSILAKVYRPQRVKILGGEPLLHKQLSAVIRAARGSQIATSYYLTTNGTLLDRMDPEIWSLIDEVEVSHYPGTLSESLLARARKSAQAHGVRLQVNEYSEFRTNLSARSNEDERLVQRIYDSCKVAHVWACHMVRQGYFFKCPRSAYLPMLLGQTESLDGIRLSEDPDFQQRLLEYLNSPTPLVACKNCVGTVGRRLPHRMLPRAEWRACLEQSVEDLIDPLLLEGTPSFAP